VGFAVTFPLQQPLFSLIGWIYIVLKRARRRRPVAIEGSKGDVGDIDFFVRTLWEINGELVSSHQPSGRVITLPSPVVLRSHVHDYSYQDVPHVWNQLSIQVAFETDLEFARAVMVEWATEYLSEEMRRRSGGIAIGSPRRRSNWKCETTPPSTSPSGNPGSNANFGTWSTRGADRSSARTVRADPRPNE